MSHEDPRKFARTILIKILWRFNWIIGKIPCHSLRRLSTRVSSAYARRKAIEITDQRNFAIQGVGDFCRSRLSRSQMIFTHEEHEPTTTQLIEISTGSRHQFSCGKLIIPPVWKFQVTNAIFVGESDIIYLHSGSIAPDHYSHDNKITREERMNTLQINRNIIDIEIPFNDNILQLDGALSCVGVPSINWAHWITETLPKIAIFAKDPALRALPLLIDSNIPATMVESINVFLGSHREIIPVNRGQAIYVQRAWCISPVAHVPYEYRNSSDVRFEDAAFCEKALEAMRSAAISICGRNESGPKKIYIKRKIGAARPLVNADEVEAFVTASGFTIVEPDSLSFAEQVQIFSNARLILGQAGAGLINFAFAQKGAVVLVLNTLSRLNNYFYFSAVGHALGQTMIHFGCERRAVGLTESLQFLQKPHTDHEPAVAYAYITRSGSWQRS